MKSLILPADCTCAKARRMEVKRRRLVPATSHVGSLIQWFRCSCILKVASETSCGPLNSAYTRAKWTLAHSGLLGDPSQQCIYTSEVDLAPFRARNGSSRDPSETCIYTSEVDLSSFRLLRDPSQLCICTSEVDAHYCWGRRHEPSDF